MGARFTAICNALTAVACVATVAAAAQPAHVKDKAGIVAEEIQKLPEDVLRRAGQGDANALYDVAQFYLSVWHHHKDDLPSEAESLLVSTYAGFLHGAAERGHAQAQLELGLRYARASEASGDPEDLRKATMWFRKAAEQGLPNAQFNLALAHHEGRGVPQNYTEAIKWYQAAADAGVAEAQLNLGLMYRQGEGVPQDYRAASHWFRKAADQDYAKAQAYLGLMYASGAGVPQDYAQAHMWLNLAVASFPPGDTRDLAVADRDSVAAHMSQDQIAEAQRMAREWLEQHRTGGAQ